MTRALCATLILSGTGKVAADDSQWGVGLKAGTLGLGAEARWSGLPWMDLRIGGNAYSFDDTGREGNVRYRSELNLETFYLTANFHFPLSPFRLTAGAFANGNELTMVGDEPGDYNFDGQTFTQGEVGTLTGKTSFGSTSPYLGLGFDFELFGKTGLNFDLGILWQGEPEVSLSAVGGSEQGSDRLNSALRAEEDNIADEMGRLKAYPVVSLSFVYNF